MSDPSSPDPSGNDRPLGGLVKHSAIYGAAPLIRQLISVGMHRLYTGWLGTSGIGVKETVDLWLIALQQLLGQNALGAMVRFYFEHKDPKDRAKVVTSCTILITILAWAVCGPALLITDTLAPLMLGPGEKVTSTDLVEILKLLLLLLPFQLSSLAGLYYLQILKRSGLYTAIQTVKLVFEVGLNFWLIGYLNLGVQGFLLSMLAGEALTSLGLSGWMLWTLRPRLDWRLLRPIFVYAAPLIPVGVCQLALHQLDRRLILALSDEGVAQAVAGVYGHGYKISYLVTAMILGPFIQIWQPFIFSVEDARERARLVARVSTYAVLAIAAASLGVILFGRQAAILLAADSDFWEAYKVIPFVAAGYVFWALYHVSQFPLFIAKRTGRLFVINLCAALVNVGLNWFLIPRYGFQGAGIATFVTFAFLSGLGMLASRSEAHVPFELGRLARMLVCVVTAGISALVLDDLEASGGASVLGAIAAKAAILVALLLILWKMILHPDERARLLGWLSKRERKQD